MEVVSEHDEPIIFDTMGEGRFFGEISVVFSCPRTASIRLELIRLKVEVNIRPFATVDHVTCFSRTP